MLKHLLAIILCFTFLNALYAQTKADSDAYRAYKTDSLKKMAAKAVAKRKLKTDSIARRIIKADSLKRLHKAKANVKHTSKTDSLTTPKTKPDSLKHTTTTKADSIKRAHKSKLTLKHPHKTDSLTIAAHPFKKDSVAKQTVKTDTAKYSPVKTMSLKQYDAYLKGEDINDLSLAAELNHYPMPDKVAKVGKQVGLTPLQSAKINELITNLNRKKKEMGVFIIRNERALDSLFRTNKINDGLLIFYTNRTGLYVGELKNAILQACYATGKLLTPLQIKRYEALQPPN